MSNSHRRLDSAEERDRALQALSQLTSTFDAASDVNDPSAIEQDDLDEGWMNALFSAMPDLEKALRAEMRRETASELTEQQRQRTLDKLGQEEKKEADFRRRQEQARLEFEAETRLRMQQHQTRSDMAREYLDARERRAAEEDWERREAVNRRASAKEAHVAALAADWRDRNERHDAQAGKWRARERDQARERHAEAARRQKEAENRERERRLSDREYWNLRREENEARKKEMLRKSREQEEAKRRRILEALQRTEEKAAEARLERSREAMRLKREKAERAAAARERVKHAERKEEERLRRMAARTEQKMSRVTEKLSRREEDRVTRRAIMQKLLKSPALRKILVDHLRARDAASKDAPPVTATRSHSGRSGSVLSRSKTTRKCGTMPQNDANSHRRWPASQSRNVGATDTRRLESTGVVHANPGATMLRSNDSRRRKERRSNDQNQGAKKSTEEDENYYDDTFDDDDDDDDSGNGNGNGGGGDDKSYGDKEHSAASRVEISYLQLSSPPKNRHETAKGGRPLSALSSKGHRSPSPSGASPPRLRSHRSSLSRSRSRSRSRSESPPRSRSSSSRVLDMLNGGTPHVSTRSLAHDLMASRERKLQQQATEREPDEAAERSLTQRSVTSTASTMRATHRHAKSGVLLDHHSPKKMAVGVKGILRQRRRPKSAIGIARGNAALGKATIPFKDVPPELPVVDRVEYGHDRGVRSKREGRKTRKGARKATKEKQQPPRQPELRRNTKEPASQQMLAPLRQDSQKGKELVSEALVALQQALGVLQKEQKEETAFASGKEEMDAVKKESHGQNDEDDDEKEEQQNADTKRKDDEIDNGKDGKYARDMEGNIKMIPKAKMQLRVPARDAAEMVMEAVRKEANADSIWVPSASFSFKGVRAQERAREEQDDSGDDDSGEKTDDDEDSSGDHCRVVKENRKASGSSGSNGGDANGNRSRAVGPALHPLQRTRSGHPSDSTAAISSRGMSRAPSGPLSPPSPRATPKQIAASTIAESLLRVDSSARNDQPLPIELPRNRSIDLHISGDGTAGSRDKPFERQLKRLLESMHEQDSTAAGSPKAQTTRSASASTSSGGDNGYGVESNQVASSATVAVQEFISGDWTIGGLRDGASPVRSRKSSSPARSGSPSPVRRVPPLQFAREKVNKEDASDGGELGGSHGSLQTSGSKGLSSVTPSRSRPPKPCQEKSPVEAAAVEAAETGNILLVREGVAGGIGSSPTGRSPSRSRSRSRTRTATAPDQAKSGNQQQEKDQAGAVPWWASLHLEHDEDGLLFTDCNTTTFSLASRTRNLIDTVGSSAEVVEGILKASGKF